MMRAPAAGLALALSMLPAAAEVTPPPDPAAISAHLREALARDRVPGGAVAVIWQGKVILLEGFGLDGDGQPVTPHTGFRLGSMSKAFTALAVMRAVEAGSLSPDAPVQSVLSDFTLADPAAAAGITLRHLLAHTSGIPRTAPRAAADAPLAAHVAALAGVAPAARPGARHIYASPNYLVAARMLEVAEGRPFADILQTAVLAPLGLTDTLVTAADGHLAPGHRYWFGFPFPANLPEEPGRLATASLIASAADMARFLRFQLGDGSWQGQRLLSPAAMAEMQRGTAAGDGFRYAMGWREGRIAGTRALHHGGILPDFRGKMILLPDLDAAVVVLTNASTLMPLPARPTSHWLADEIAASLAGEPLASGTLTFGTVVLAVWAGLALLLAGQARRLWSRPGGADRAGQGAWRGPLDLTVAAGLAAWPPILTGLSWRELWTGSPDLAIWTGATALLVAAAGVRGLWRRRPVAHGPR
jgi:CubicO group peptidase (beta-lactamase class C family)